MNGIEISRLHYRSTAAPGLAGAEHAAGLFGAGSEVLGFDDDVSTDHDFGKRVLIFRSDAGTGAYFRDHVGFDPAATITVADWLLTPTQKLAELTGGEVFHDPHGWLTTRRTALTWYPDDVWRYALAGGWLRVGQEEAFVARTGSTGDDLGSRLLAGRLVRELTRLAFLVRRRWAPYGKWLGRAFAGLDGELHAVLSGALSATGWRERESLLCTAGSVLAAATNDLGLAEPVDPAARRFYDRDIRVVGGEGRAKALTAAITDPVLTGVLARLGTRNDGIPCLPGTIDQAVDSTDVLRHHARFRSAGPLLGLT
jgi:hypothetical protein